MRRKNLLKELGIQKQADISCNALDIDTENVRQRVYAKLDFADTERKQTTMRSKKKILPFQRTKFQIFLKKQEKECHHNL